MEPDKVSFRIIAGIPPPSAVSSKPIRDKILKSGLPWNVRHAKSGIEFVLIPSGEFELDEDETDLSESELPNLRAESFAHVCSYWKDYKSVSGCTTNHKKIQVILDQPFYVARTPITYKQLEESKSGVSLRCSGKFNPDNYELPVQGETFEGATEYLKSIDLRLPTEAEWEYSCRADSEESRYGKLDEIAWYFGNSEGSLHPVGKKAPNGFGLFDMIGNVWEWCSDWYCPILFESGFARKNRTNPMGPEAGTTRVIRGGSFKSDATMCRASFRGDLAPADALLAAAVGFRPAVAANSVWAQCDARSTDPTFRELHFNAKEYFRGLGSIKQVADSGQVTFTWTVTMWDRLQARALEMMSMPAGSGLEVLCRPVELDVDPGFVAALELRKEFMTGKTISASAAFDAARQVWLWSQKLDMAMLRKFEVSPMDSLRSEGVVQ